jgi:hypothetical protein
MASHALLMVHNAWTDQAEDEKVMNALKAINGSLSKIFIERTGQTEDEFMQFMEKETWFNADQAKELKLIDNIYSKPKPVNKASVMAVYNNLKQSKMQKVVQYLNLGETATEEQVIQAIETAKTDPKVGELEKENAELKAKLEAIEAEKEAEELARIEAEAVEIVNAEIEAGKFKVEDKDTLLTKAKADLEGFKMLVKAVKVPHASITNAITEPKEDRSKWGYREWVDKDSKGFMELKNSNPELFNLILKTARNK